MTKEKMNKHGFEKASMLITFSSGRTVNIDLSDAEFLAASKMLGLKMYDTANGASYSMHDEDKLIENIVKISQG